MMVDLGKYAGDVLIAYGITLGLLAGLVLWTWRGARRMRAELRAIEDRRNGAPRG